MTKRLLFAVAVALLLVLAFAAVAQAGVSQSVIDAIIEDAQDGTIDGNWTAAQIQAALAYIRNNPLYQQYSDLEGVLTDYQASAGAPGATGGSLAFTGGDVTLFLAAGSTLLAGGAFLRRRRT